MLPLAELLVAEEAYFVPMMNHSSDEETEPQKSGVYCLTIKSLLNYTCIRRGLICVGIWPK